METPTGLIVSANLSRGSMPPQPTSSILKCASSIAMTILISASAKYRPEHRRGPPPNGMTTCLAESMRPVLAPSPSHR